MSANRAFFCVALTAYIEARHIGPNELGPSLLSAGLAMTAMIFAHIVVYPAPNVTRRTFALIADFSTLLTVMHFADEEGAAFYPLILWTIFGNGFRFGVSALWVAVMVGSLGFAVVAATTPFWQLHASLAAGLGLGTLTLPAYAAVLIKRLTQARQRAEAANEAKSTFLTNVSHELRTPLQALVGTTELLKRTGLTAEQNELARITSTASETLLSMINDFLKFTNLNASYEELEFVPTNPIRLLQDVAGLSIADCKAKGLRLALHVGLGTPTMVNADGRYIREVLLNFIGNALKFTATGGILLAVEGLHSDDRWVLRFSVTDTGIGVPEGAKERIFERFTQADETIAQRFGGTGLGLAICKRRVERMSGQLGVQDGIGHGSVFWFEVPVLPVDGASCMVNPPRAPVMLLLTAGMAKGRFAKAASDQKRNLTHPAVNSLSRSAEAPVTPETGHICVLQTSAAAQSHRELGADASWKTRDDRHPVVIVDDADLPSPLENRDLRWIATVRLPTRFSDQQMFRALEIADHFAEVAPEAEAQSLPPIPLEWSKVLIVDDNKTNQVIYSKLLGTAGCHCQVAGNGEEALHAMDANGFDLVLMDVNMSVMDGLQATKLQRVAELGMSRVPIIGITADASPEMERKCLAAGMDACLIKPVSSATLLRLVAELLGAVSRKPQALYEDGLLHQEQGQSTDVDWQIVKSLIDVGGSDFLRELLTEFVKDCRDLLGDLRVAAASKQIGQARAAAHAIASSSANVGALRVRSLASQFERLSEDLIQREGTRRVGQIREAVRSYLKAFGEVAGEGGGRQLDFD